MFKEFWDKETLLIKFSGFITAFAGIFLAISLPEAEKAKKAIQNIQIFWLFLLATLLTVLIIKFIQWFYQQEKKGFIDDLKTFGLLTLSAGYLLLWLVLNFYQYIANLYPERFSEFAVTAIPLVVLVFIVSFENVSRKWTLFTNFVVISFILASTITYLGIFIQNIFLKYFYLYWMTTVFPGLFILFFSILLGISLYRRKYLV